MKPLWVLTAFVLGFIVNRVGLPPLVGYLIAGFALNALGAEGGGAIENIADLGVILLLFSIGLKLRLRSLAKPEVWAGASLHMLITVLLFGVLFVVLGATGLQAFSGMGAQTALIIAFSLSFSSTVFAVKVLEGRSEMASLHGRVSIGILIRSSGRIRLVLLAMAEHAANMYAARRILDSPYPGMVAATAKFDDDAAELKVLGVHAVHNLYAEAGAGFAEHALQMSNK